MIQTSWQKRSVFFIIHMFIFLWVTIQHQEIASKQNFRNLSMKKQDFYLIDRLKDNVMNILPINSLCYCVCLGIFKHLKSAWPKFKSALSLEISLVIHNICPILSHNLCIKNLVYSMWICHFDFFVSSDKESLVSPSVKLEAVFLINDNLILIYYEDIVLFIGTYN